MKKILIGLILIVLSGMSLADKPKTFFPYKYTQEKLANGLTVILIPLESHGLVSYYSVARTGSRDEWEKGHSGFAHFFEHMMFRGTKKHPEAEYQRITTEIGSSGNAYTTDDYTCYYMTFAKEDLETVIDLESDRFQNLQYEEPAFQTESGAVYGEFRKGRTSPFSVLNEKMQDLAYTTHTYKHTTIGFEEDIKAMPTMYEYSKSFFQRYYRPENIVVMVVGDIKTDDTMKMIKKYYSDWKKGYVLPQIQSEPAQTSERTAEITYAGKTLPIIDIAYKGDALTGQGDNKKLLSALLLGELGFGENSALYKKLVITEQKIQFIQAGFDFNRDPGLLEIYSMVKDEKDLNYVRDEVYKTLDEFKAKPVDAKKLSDLKKRQKYSFLMNLDTPGSVAGRLARFVALTGGIEIVDQIYDQYDQITPQDIMSAAAYYFTPEKRTVVVLKGGQ